MHIRHAFADPGAQLVPGDGQRPTAGFQNRTGMRATGKCTIGGFPILLSGSRLTGTPYTGPQGIETTFSRLSDIRLFRRRTSWEITPSRC